MHLIAYPIVKDYAQVAPRARQGRAGGHHRHAGAVVVADGVAGDGVGHPRILFAFRSRSHSVVAGRRAAAVCGAHRHHDAGDGADVAVAGVTVHQRPGRARRTALARRLRGRAGGQPHRDGVRAGADHRAVHDAGAEADAAGRPGHGRRHRRGLRHRAPTRRDRIARQPVPHRNTRLLRTGRDGPGKRQHALLAGARRRRRPCGARGRRRLQRVSARRVDRAVCAAFRRLRPCRRRRVPQPRRAGSRRPTASGDRRHGAPCG